MTTLSDYVAEGTFAGQKVAVKAKKVVWVKVGEGVVQFFADREVSIGGKISILGYSGDLNIYLQLASVDGGASAGTCTLQLNSHRDEHARFEVGGEALTVYAVLSGKEQNISILRCNNGQQTECRLFGHFNQTVHLDPKR